MTNEYALHLLSQLQIGASVDAKPIIPQYEFAQALGVAIKALEQQPCEDCISREAMLSLQTEYAEKMGSTTFWKLRDDIRALPPVTPQRPKGKWIEYEVDIVPHPLHCSICGFSNHHISNRYMKEFRRCPNCGAEMSGGGEDGVSN